MLYHIFLNFTFSSFRPLQEIKLEILTTQPQQTERLIIVEEDRRWDLLLTKGKIKAMIT